ncbi:MAG: hypothetical protein EBS54_08170 [Betaproteobacteria bacterium]|nr:hypothetical protein [Betaproteobacteria bacterium]NBQ80116.1 hypothetical protein [Betaproteobacteria bacterium]NBT06677.1 hypothetical protein [Betaproteobacteria bacterium]NCY08516.1 hypothetical protein [Betaproteobacteria bacterium]NDC04252.1 hypothetical protein [Betaproteobacteria bacterium]
MKKHSLGLFAIIGAVFGSIAACSDGSSSPFSVALIGDSPYGAAYGDTAQLKANPAFIAAVGRDTTLSMALHVGDIHSGKEFCTESFNRTIFDQWKAFTLPLVYVPGDNEWADCHKAKEGGGTYSASTGSINYVTTDGGSYAKGDPIANLALIRSIFFSTPGKTLGAAMEVRSQAVDYDRAYPSDAQFVENTWFEKNSVVFMTLNIPGGSNNDNDIWYGAPTMSDAQKQEVATRTAANLRWIDSVFSKAMAINATAVLIQVQADMWDQDGVNKVHLTEYKQFIDKIASNTKAFGKPVLLVNGDSHNYRSDNPLLPGSACVVEAPAPAGANGALGTAGKALACNDPAVASVAATYHADAPGVTDPYANQPWGYQVPNFHRLVLHTNAATALEYLRLTVDASANAANGSDAFGPFKWARVVP